MLEAEFHCVWLSAVLLFLISLDETVRLGWICSVYWDAEGGGSPVYVTVDGLAGSFSCVLSLP